MQALVMNKASFHKPDQPAGGCVDSGKSGETGGGLVWIISRNDALAQQLIGVLQSLTTEVCHVKPESMTEGLFRRRQGEKPGLVVLDVGRDVDGALRIIQSIKRHRIKAPIVVVTDECSRDFGAKIISQGVRYYFTRDFNPREFLQVAGSYLKINKPSD
ncbi:MAG: hypothetical protein Kow0059_16120 [Candidatus Sumerlaeia bacterium]